MRATIACMKQLEYALWKYAVNLEDNTHAEMWF